MGSPQRLRGDRTSWNPRVASQGEARHTSTFLGILAAPWRLPRSGNYAPAGFVAAAASEGRWLLERLQSSPRTLDAFNQRPRGVGLMAGIELRHADGSPAGDVSPGR